MCELFAAYNCSEILSEFFCLLIFRNLSTLGLLIAIMAISPYQKKVGQFVKTGESTTVIQILYLFTPWC